MKKQILITLGTLLAAQSLHSMRLPARVCPKTRPVPTSHAKPCLPRALARRAIIRGYHQEINHEIARQEAWRGINDRVTGRVCDLLDQAAEHASLAATHADYARICEILARLERDKHEILLSTVAKLNKPFDFGEFPNLDHETKIAKIVISLQEQLRGALPREKCKITALTIQAKKNN